MDSSLQQSGTHPLDIAELKQVIKNRFSFDRRRMIFFTINSCLLGLAFFSLFSAITLESNSQISRIRSILIMDPLADLEIRAACRKLETILIPQNLAQLCVIICGVIGFFGIEQKSKKVLFMYPLALLISTIFRIIATVLIVFYYNELKTVFPNEGQIFFAIEIVFLVMHFIFSYFCYDQFKKAQVEYFIVFKDKERLITDNNMAFEVIKRIIRN